MKKKKTPHLKAGKCNFKMLFRQHIVVEREINLFFKVVQLLKIIFLYLSNAIIGGHRNICETVPQLLHLRLPFHKTDEKTKKNIPPFGCQESIGK